MNQHERRKPGLRLSIKLAVSIPKLTNCLPINFEIGWKTCSNFCPKSFSQQLLLCPSYKPGTVYLGFISPEPKKKKKKQLRNCCLDWYTTCRSCGSLIGHHRAPSPPAECRPCLFLTELCHSSAGAFFDNRRILIWGRISKRTQSRFALKNCRMVQDLPDNSFEGMAVPEIPESHLWPDLPDSRDKRNDTSSLTPKGESSQQRLGFNSISSSLMRKSHLA